MINTIKKTFCKKNNENAEKIFELDSSDAKVVLTKRQRETKIPMRISDNYADFDMIECDVPKDVYAQYKKDNDDYGLPIGINLDTLPVGVKITRVK